MPCTECRCTFCIPSTISDAFHRIDRLEHDRNEQAKDIANLRKRVHRLGGIVEKMRAKVNEPHVIMAQSCGSDCCPSDCPDCAAWQEENRQHFLPLKEFDRATSILSELLDKYGPSWSWGPREIGIKLREALHILGVNKS